MIYFDEQDVVRHNLVQRIIKAYDAHASSHPGRNSPAAPSARPAAYPPKRE
jgi:phosphate starvation-inducible protein PhoH